MSAQTNRLPDAAGSALNRGRSIGFSFEGKRYQAYEGDTIASALAANGVWMLSRSFKYHRPRGVLTMAGQDANTLVQLPGEPNVLADRRLVEDGMVVTAQNVNGSLAHDRDAVMGLFSRFMPVGFYYKAFFRPQGVWRWWERLVRAKAGLGKVSLDAEHSYHDKAYGYYDTVVIGGGPAGLSAALAAATAQRSVLLVEEHPVLGGSLNYARFGADRRAAARKRDELVAAVAAAPNIEVMTSATCNGWFADHWLPVVQGRRMFKVRAGEVVLASGALEQPAQFRNNDLPGVMLGTAAQRLIHLYGVRPGQRAVVLAGNDDGHAVALDLVEAGVELAAVLDLRAAGGGDCAEALVRRGVRVLYGHAVSEALGTGGGRHLRAVAVAPVTGRGQLGPVSETLECDLLAVSVGYTPAYQLAVQSGAKLGYEDSQAMFAITGQAAGMRLAGAVNGRFGLDDLLADGTLAGGGSAPATQPAVGVNHPWPLFPHPKGKEFVDFDEDLQVCDIVNACADGYSELELVKRYSTVGMGPSQGRHSALVTARLVADSTGRSVAETGVTTARPPFTQESLAVLGGRGFEPERRTPMHYRHRELGAQMMVAGLWWRPAYYGAPEQRDECVRREVLAVRNGVGLVDVSTLGGLEVRGPDAAEFLNRMYTSAYLKQPVGRARYALMTDQAGTIIDDGVACRLGPRHFYVTATTSGVDRVYRQMLWWNAQWRLDVDVTNVTAAWAGVNLAGPRSREVLLAAGTDIDVSAEAMPYMAVRTGTVAGLPARVLRVGFVGELGYEIHVAASHGEALWDALMAAGQGADIRPFGVEAQRQLRLEKGHIIIGQDTDGASFPDEAEMAWAVGANKPFFVGQRSIELRRRQPLRRRLVGVGFDDAAVRPDESNLIIAGDKVLGHLTSVGYSPSLGHTVAMALIATEHAEPGTGLTVRLSDGRAVSARVVTMPFYDPDNQRQAL